MKSKRILPIAFILLSLASSQAFSAPLNVQGDDLRQKLIQLYESSRTPFLMKENAIRSKDDRGIFQGCTVVLKDGTVRDLDPPLVIVTFRITHKEGHGPLSPPVMTEATGTFQLWSLESLIANGAVFRNGILDLDSVSGWGGTVDECQPPLSARESWALTSSGISSDGFSYERRGVCGGGKVWLRENYRLASGYLVVKDSDETYAYCWK